MLRTHKLSPTQCSGTRLLRSLGGSTRSLSFGFCAALAFSAGCSAHRQNMGVSHGQYMTYAEGHVIQGQPVATGSHLDLAAPTGGFGTQIQPAAGTASPTQINPLQVTPPPQSYASEDELSTTPTQALDAWNQFQNETLFAIQRNALNSVQSDDDILGRLTEDGKLGGGGTISNAVDGPRRMQRLLLQRIAEAFVDTRANQQRLQDLYENLAVQQAASELATARKSAGKAGRMDILQMESSAGLTESQMSPVRDNLRNALRRLTILSGETLTKSMIQTIAGERQLHLPELDQRLPASILRQRCDVRTAEQSVTAMGQSAGVIEAALLPHLALQGELTAKIDSRRDDDTSDLGIDMGSESSWNFAKPANQLPREGAFTSPLQNAMRAYESTVYNAATEVETLLTDYHELLQDVRSLEQAAENASEATRLALQQFEVDRIRGAQVAQSQARKVKAGQALVDARERLAQTAIELFMATGAECKEVAVPFSAGESLLD